MFWFNNNNRESRKYVDLINQAESKWGNWDPDVQYAKVGDYGVINKETGAFEVHGNIEKEYPGLWAGAEEGQINNFTRINSKGASVAEVVAAPEVKVPTVADISAKFNIKFSGQRGAVLFMHKPRQTVIKSLPRPELLKDYPRLAGKCLVTGVASCPAYALYLSSSNGEEVSMSLTACVPAAAGVTVGGQGSVSRKKESGCGIFRSGGDLKKESGPLFTPLFSLKAIPKPWFSFLRGDSAPEREDLEWTDAETPWGDLHEDGEEDAIVADDGIPDW